MAVVSENGTTVFPARPERAPEAKRCFDCGVNNPDQGYCGSCGAPLEMRNFIASRVTAELEQKTKERDLIQRELAITAFDKVCGWLRNLAWVAGIVIAIVVLSLATFGINKWSDLVNTIGLAKQGVIDAAAIQRKQIETASANARDGVAKSSAEAIDKGNAAATSALAARTEIARETEDVRNKVAGLDKQVEAANRLGPQMASMQEQLAQQQKTLSSSEEFVRSVFGSHQVEFFLPDQAASSRYRILPRLGGTGATVYLLLGKTPIRQTLELKYHTFPSRKIRTLAYTI